MKTTLSPAPRQQRGVTLVVVLVMLMIVTLLGLASIRGSTTQERMVTGFYDRSLSMQSAEAALRAGFAEIIKAVEAKNKTTVKIVDCTDANKKCAAIPASTFDGGGDDWNTVNVARRPNTSLAAGAPQFYIQSLGTSSKAGRGVSGDNRGDKNRSDDDGYIGRKDSDKGKSGGGSGMPVYRIIARSADPADKNVDGRSLVVLSGITH